MPSDHAKLSPSGSATWFTCPASVTLVERHGLQELDTSSPAADFGTQCHQISEDALRDGTPIPDDIPELMADYARRYVAYIRDREKGRKVFYEGRVTLDESCWGTADTILPDTRIPAVIDLKTGQFPVYAKDSKQLRIYALAMLKTFRIKWEDIDGVEMTIHQPSTENINTYTITTYELKQFEHDYNIARQNLVLRPMHFQPSPDSCQWCRAKPHCPAFEQVILEEARVAFSNLKEIEMSRLSDMLQWLPTLKRFIIEVESFTKSRMEDGESVPGYKLSNPYQRRVWDEQKLRVVAARYNLSKVFLEQKPISFSSADKIMISLDEEARTDIEDCIGVNVGTPRILIDKSDK